MAPQTIVLANDVAKVGVRVKADGATSLAYILPAEADEQPSCSPHFDDSTLPLIELRLSGEGNASRKTAKALVGGYIASRLQYHSHSFVEDEQEKTTTLRIELRDDDTKVAVSSRLTLRPGSPFLRSTATVLNRSDVDIIVNQVPSLVVGAMTRSPRWWSDYEISYANNTWFREAQWVTRSLPNVGLDDFGLYGWPAGWEASIATFSLSNHSSFSTQRYLPMGALHRKDNSETWLWQVENNGSWQWEVGDMYDNLYVALSGPNADNHEWRQRLAPNETFNTIPASIAHIHGDLHASLAALNEHRRLIRLPHGDHKSLPIIFNDYMNCLMGDPTEDKILALVGPVARSGAEYFVIDCGWYADDNDWWNDVGLWEPSKKRFPSGFSNLLSKIRAAGLKPGLWIEPEVVGVQSIVANQLPSEAFFQRDGKRVVEKERYQLDFRHPAVIERMDGVIRRCVEEYGAQYFKFDYNIEVTQGTDVSTSSPGAAQLDHQRAYIAWVTRLLERYPGLVIENCSSGAQRMDYAMLSVHTLQSTSDQQYPHHYAVIAASAPTAVTPEQSATWAYPQGDWPDETNALTVVNSLLGRVHLSGRLDVLNQQQLELICDGMRVYREIRHHIPTASPFWPLGLPGWHDDWLALGLESRLDRADTGRLCFVSVWRRAGDTQIRLPLQQFSGRKGVKVAVLYPTQFFTDATWDDGNTSVLLTLPETTCARLIQIEG